MKKFLFEQASFFRSVADMENLPTIKSPFGDSIPEIAIAGRSNVGKSSLINHVLKDKKLARTSSMPGKTQLLNFFLIDERLFLVDLPGYGYAKVSKSIQDKWTQCLADYFDKRKSLQLILLLLDIRRDPSEEDLALLDWARHYNKSLCVIFTKCDKLSKPELAKRTSELLKTLQEYTKASDLHCVHFSIHDRKARDILIEKLTNYSSNKL